MNKIKIWSMFMLVVIALPMMLACGGDEGDDSESKTNNSEQSNNGGSNNNSGENSTTKIESVDLGLSVRWGNVNIGSTSMEGFGDLYAWGEVSTKTTYTNSNYKFYHTYYKDKDGVSIDSIYCDAIGNEIQIEKDGKYYSTYDISGTEYDAAHVKLGNKWRLPTYKELKELKDNCTWKWGSINKVYGYKITAKNGNYIFLPASGFGWKEGRSDGGKLGNYMSSTIVEKESDTSKDKGMGMYGIDFSSNEVYYGYHGRIFGFSIRPVCD